MNLRLLPFLIALSVLGCKPQDPAPLPPEVGTRSTPAAAPVDDSAPTLAVTDADAGLAANPDAPEVATAAATTSVDGESVYKKACITCHGTGIAGAPKLGDAADWAPRIAQGEALLFEHATKGYTGKKGMMPPRGGFMTLSDDEMHAAISFMTDSAK